ncbi:MAG TPA: ABC transporter ATP-binding protein [Paracoccus sp.]|nr:ABC transporter ATP-binding protein [Paracoccus sp. (in: a-proteobacteria)]
MTELFKATRLSKSYGAFKAIQEVSFDVRRGEGFAIIGPNGAGKTTLFKCLTGESPISGGSIHFAGEDISHLPAFMRTRLGMGRTFQVARIFPESTVLENLLVAIEARLHSEGGDVGRWYHFRPRTHVIEEACHRLNTVGLYTRRFEEAAILSHGDKKRLELAISLALDPAALMLDEPTAGMSPAERRSVIDMIRKLREDQGITIMLTEHDMDVVYGLADRIMVLNYGQMVALGTPGEVREDPVVLDIYLGREATADA